MNFTSLFLELLTGVLLKVHQFKAMFMKRLLHSKRNKGALLTQFFLPLAFTIIALSIAITVKPISDEPSRLLSLRDLSVDNKNTKSMFANSFGGSVTFQVKT